jgi:hypothetical protein
MVPTDFTNFFSVMAGVGATLFGLIFLVISIKPEIVRDENTSVRRQVKAASAYGALLNPLVISLIALVPHATIGNITLSVSAIGLVNTIVMGISLRHESVGWMNIVRNIVFILGSLTIYGFEIFYGIRLAMTPGDLATLYSLVTLLVIIYLYGIARAWDLVGVRQFHIQEMLLPLLPKGTEETTSDVPKDKSK